MSHARERAIWDARAAAFDLAGLRREAGFVADEALWQWARERVAEAAPGRVLDLGCGRGLTTAQLAADLPLVVGLDISEGALAAAAAYAADVGVRPGLVAAGIESLPFRDGAFDVVAGRFVLHHAESLPETAAEFARVLVPGGRAVFVETWGKNPLLLFGRDLAELFQIGDGTPDERPLGAEELTVLAREFEVEIHFPQFTAFELLNRLFRRLMPLVRRSPFVRRWLARIWPAAIRADRWIERSWPWARSWGWFVGLTLTRRPSRLPI